MHLQLPPEVPDVVQRAAGGRAHEGVDVGAEVHERLGQVRAHEAVRAGDEDGPVGVGLAEVVLERDELVLGPGGLGRVARQEPKPSGGYAGSHAGSLSRHARLQLRPLPARDARQRRALAVSHEHIVVDGGSTDGTVELLEAREDPSLSWVSEPDRGQTHAVNKGFERATGRAARLAERRRRVRLGGGRPGGRAPARQSGARRRLRRRWTSPTRTGAVRREYRPVGVQLASLSLPRRLRADADDHLPPPPARAGRPAGRAYVDAADYDFFLRLFRGARVEGLARAARALPLPPGEQDGARRFQGPARGAPDPPEVGARHRTSGC